MRGSPRGATWSELRIESRVNGMVEHSDREPCVFVESPGRNLSFAASIPPAFGRRTRAKRLCACSSGGSGPNERHDHRATPPWIAPYARPLESQRGFDTSTPGVPPGLERRKNPFRLIGCQDIVGRIGLVAVMPSTERARAPPARHRNSAAAAFLEPRLLCRKTLARR